MITFEERYKALNPAQKEAVDSIEGPVMVIAGPGTGKTSILTLRIANILKRTDTPPDAILALTFTESGVRAMRKKLGELIGAAAYRVKIHTFHSFSNDIIRTYPEKFPRIIGSEHVEGLEQIALVEKILDSEEGDFDLLRPKGDPKYYVQKIISAIKDLKREDVSPERLKENIIKEEKEILSSPDLRHEKGKYTGKIKGEYQERLDAVAKNKELARAYELYEKKLEEAHLYDFEDMIIEAVKRLRDDEDFRMRLQEENHYILADEHQDANTAQNELLELISSFHEEPNLFIVGDEKQAIFRFQGASLQNFLYFKKRFPNAKLIRLKENYRSHQTILDASYALISNNIVPDEALRVELVAKSGRKSQKIECIKLPDIQSELRYVSREIKKLLDSGVSSQEIAVLVRNNKHAEAVERSLVSSQIPTARYADADVLDHPYVESFFSLIRAALNPHDDEVLAKSLYSPFIGLDFITASKALNDHKKEKTALLDILKRNADTKDFALMLTGFSRAATGDPLVESFESIAKESGFVKFLIGHKKSRELLPLYSALLTTITRFAERDRSSTLKDFMDKLDHARKHGYSISANYVPPNGVSLMTAHGSKGLEFDYVFIIHSSDSVWGGKKTKRVFKLPCSSAESCESGTDSEDERRLFYVALTRARKHAVITYAERDSEGKELSPSRFILEIPEAHVSQKNDLPEFAPSLEPLNESHTLKDKEYLKKIFSERGFPVTHLNNFLDCPWRYFFLNLLCLPKAQENSQLYGSAMHQALCHYFEAYKREEDVSIDETLDLFEKYLRRTHMGERDLKVHVKEGREDLGRYLKSYKFPRAIWNEFKITGVPFDVDGEKIMLNGTLDKIELLDSGNANVVDYKTGKPKTRNEIEGKTQKANGDYKRQLVFYKLILDRYKDGEWKMKTGTLDFIKPDERGKLHREIFEVSDEDVKNLEEQIKDSVRKILTFSFNGCKESGCEWCRFKDEIGWGEI